MDSGAVDSQVQILKSERVAKAVIKELKLVDENRKKLEDGDPSFVSRILGVVAPFISNSSVPSEFELERGLLDELSRRLKVRRIGLSYVISIEYRSPSSERAAEVANQLAVAYIVDQLEAKYQATRRASVWLQDRIAKLRDQALAADRAEQDFRAKNNIVDT